jgi:hypothetical protein
MHKVMKTNRIIIFIVLGISLMLLNSCNLNNYSKTEDNYGFDVLKYAKENDLPTEYLKALIILECSGNKPAGQRFEQSVYEKLKEVQNGTLNHFETIRKKHLIGCSDAALKNLATSWGPFQIMGYKCIKLGVLVEDLSGNESVKWGIKWINNEYGNLLRSGKYEEAFRLHNTGSIIGNTYDPEYVTNGLNHIEYFEAIKSDYFVEALPEKFKVTPYFDKFDLENRLVIFVDFQKPRTKRRLWVVENNQIIATSYVAHGVGSGQIKPTKFSNEIGSKMSSLGIYRFNYYISYQKRPKNKGYKFILNGLDSSNNQAAKRNIVIHLPPKNKEYVSENGCTGNSDGCFVVSTKIFDLIKNKTGFKSSYLLVMN